MTPMNPHTPPPSTSIPVHGHSESSVWPPPATGGDSSLPDSFQNTSGTDGPLPPEIARLKWNWGAFGLTPFWLGYHKMLPAAVGLVAAMILITVIESKYKAAGILDFGLWGYYIYLGLNGHKLAWQKRRYESLEQYFKVESAWRYWTYGLIVVTLVVSVLAILLPVIMSARHAT